MLSQTGTGIAEPKNKLLGLEVIRFVSALSVLVWHYQHFAFVGDAPANFIRENQPFYPFLKLFYEYGYLGVHVFWCISGFIFFWKYKDSVASGKVSGKSFFLLRFSRLYPLHFASLITVLLLQLAYFSQRDTYFVYQFDDLRHFFLQLFLASNWGFQRGDSFNGPIWSISIETLVYVVFFLMLRFVGKAFYINIAIIVLSLATKFLNIHSSIFDCLIFFYAGGLSAIALKHFETSKYRQALKIIAFAVLLALPFASYLPHVSTNKNFAVLFLLAFVPTLLFIGGRNFKASETTQHFIEVAGNMTYASYLIHFPLQLIISLYFIHANLQIPYNNPLFFVHFISTVLVLSYFTYRYFERPAQDAIRAFGKPKVAPSGLGRPEAA